MASQLKATDSNQVHTVNSQVHMVSNTSSSHTASNSQALMVNRSRAMARHQLMASHKDSRVLRITQDSSVLMDCHLAAAPRAAVSKAWFCLFSSNACRIRVGGTQAESGSCS